MAAGLAVAAAAVALGLRRTDRADFEERTEARDALIFESISLARLIWVEVVLTGEVRKVRKKPRSRGKGKHTLGK